MTDIADEAVDVELIQRTCALRQVEATVRRLEAQRPTFLCRDCLDPIEPERLQAVPGAGRCITCQEAEERSRRVHSRSSPWRR